MLFLLLNIYESIINLKDYSKKIHEKQPKYKFILHCYFFLNVQNSLMKNFPFWKKFNFIFLSFKNNNSIQILTIFSSEYGQATFIKKLIYLIVNSQKFKHEFSIISCENYLRFRLKNLTRKLQGKYMIGLDML